MSEVEVMRACKGIVFLGFAVMSVACSACAQDRTSDAVDSAPVTQDSLPRAVTETLPGDIPLELVLIEPGEFMMGAVPGDDWADAHEKPRHIVTISKPLYIGKYEVTQAQWKAVMGTTLIQQRAVMDPQSPTTGIIRGEGPNYPMYYLRWGDVQEFCRKLSLVTGNKYRLPTEAEWEYACRAGRTTKYYWGDEFDGDYAWYEENSGGLIHPVGQKLGNEWGLYDMAGNVFEWCADYYSPAYYSSGKTTDPQNTQKSESYVVRGGSWGNGPKDMRASHRFNADEGHFLGFRIVQDVR